MNNMVPFECLVSMSGVTRKIVRYFEREIWAYTWLELEGYKVFYIKRIKDANA